MSNTANLRQKVLVSYRKLLRISRIRFANDTAVLSAARERLRSEYESKKELADVKKIEAAVFEAEEAEIVLRKLVVQGEAADDKPNTFRLKLAEEHERIR
ncbi:hypothetical protein BB560_004271 [Smittium megazygosporum]|uniref:Mitochondrial zinc maintenance protein 1, mitochondrial n=1 Tax=Smittium megazygosporum TaxID=133381 RepID=A0A2T9Z9R4_9FUNG|nr:hypothetical protein BB560_004271 [Smittium megazygosporum]